MMQLLPLYIRTKRKMKQGDRDNSRKSSPYEHVLEKIKSNKSLGFKWIWKWIFCGIYSRIS